MLSRSSSGQHESKDTRNFPDFVEDRQLMKLFLYYYFYENISSYFILDPLVS